MAYISNPNSQQHLKPVFFVLLQILASAIRHMKSPSQKASYNFLKKYYDGAFNKISLVGTFLVKTLLNPLSRGLYLLELSGVEPAQETDCDADSAFLMEIMEINEKLAEPKNEDILAEIETLIKVKQEELTREVTAAFERDDLQGAKKLLAKMKYFANLEDKLKAKKIPS
ncbi:PREDICTED: iron-sulfur cluster co-chaperone protein HscB, mitochondrial [Corvus brachyrhynchos]|uniref:iron-sulfur cluster co-chaperone protein HscB, mitochondrial n=1 Tax=Corvus brachyrhynchos TaxID=85066 RepID=UPI0008163E50|nr:PREDICTED: iron-sulfur cluster co-chaperone protein HscB, mitochondrial [Corvus brachyrhynchos]